ncbi:MAG: hypothetical protein M0031_09820 [Thermaerobacter sp.]|nr:hypothetical protein [Thermaerobacter sp.]
MTQEAAWWTELRRGGLLIAPAVLAELFPGLPPLSSARYARLRDRYHAFAAGQDSGARDAAQPLAAWLDGVLEDFLDQPRSRWAKGRGETAAFAARGSTGEELRPQRVLLSAGKPVLLVQVDRERRVGIGRGRGGLARFLTLLRASPTPLGLLTNGLQFRLLYAGLDFEAWVEWEVADWFDTAEGRDRLAGFALLLGTTGLPPAPPEPLLRAVELSRSRQGELAQVMGEQVRRAVEVLLEGVSREASRRPSLLEPLERESGGSQTEILGALFQAAIRVVMRLVVIFFAEARDLLPRSLETYYDSYSLEGLFEQLLRARSTEGTHEMAQRLGAWPRLLALFRLIHAGSAHGELPLPAYGGALFRPGRADSPDPVLRALAVLEGCQLSDREVDEVLRLLKLGRLRTGSGRSARWMTGPVDFADLRTEYIGMMYEGLLEYLPQRVSSSDQAQVTLRLGQEPVLPLSFLEGLPAPVLSKLLNTLAKEKGGPAGAAEDEEEEALGLEAAASEEPEAQGLPASAAEGEEGEEEQEALRRRAEACLGRATRRVEEARRLVGRIYAPGEIFLVQGLGTRKGSGTFYTRPALAVPTVHRVLRPLVYDAAGNPRTPEEILSLKVVDPAMGSASFLVAALRYLTEALYQSLVFHRQIEVADGPKTLPFGTPSLGAPEEELMPVAPGDEDFAARVQARLKRHVVERCIHGVDINPLAVELARLSLWVETMDRELPFEFLDHKLKVGNSLVGTWLDRFQFYPAAAWQRDGGDGPKGQRTAWLKGVLREQVRPQLPTYRAKLLGQREFTFHGPDVSQVQERYRQAMEELHGRPESEREALYRQAKDEPGLRQVREACDRWAALWFWPIGQPPLLPGDFAAPGEQAGRLVAELAHRERFFHWELEFPDVFTPRRRGFDAVLGNPPWDTRKPSSLEFFSRHDPLYRSYGKQEALEKQRRLFRERPALEAAWLDYQAQFKALGNWVKRAAQEGGPPASEEAGLADPETPFRHQGSADLNTYKLFLEAAWHLLRPGGRLGFLVPSAVYTDYGSRQLRRLFLERGRWEWLFGFENRERIFQIDSRYKFCVLMVEKGGQTDQVQAAFMRRDPGDWEAHRPEHLLITREAITRFSPENRSFLEFKSERDQAIAGKLYAHPLLGGEGGWRVRMCSEFHMTNDSRLFPPLPWWEERGYRPDGYGRWVGPGGAVALPLYEGRMIHQFDFSFQGYEAGRGIRATWREQPWDGKDLQPEYLMAAEDYLGSPKAVRGYKVGFRNIAPATNTRTMIACVVVDRPCGNSLSVFSCGQDLGRALRLSSLLNSLAYDWVVRQRCGGLNLNFFYLAETPLPIVDDPDVRRFLTLNAASLTFVHKMFAPEWLRLRERYPELGERPWQEHWAVTASERLRRRCMLDAVVAHVYGLDYDDLAYILRDDADEPTGFWRVDRELPREQRQTTLTLEAFRHLLEVGLERFCQEGWDLPAHARDFPRPGVARFTPAAGWDEAAAHARRMEEIREQGQLTAAETAAAYDPSPEDGQLRLFPDPPGGGKR